MADGAVIIASSLNGPCRVLRDAGHDPGVLLPDPSTTGVMTRDRQLSLSAFVGFFQKAAVCTGDTGFGWRAGQGFDITTLGETGEAVLAAPKLGHAVAAFCNAFALVQTDSILTLSVTGGEAVLSYRILDPRIWPRDQDAEFTLSILATLVASVAGPGWRPLRMEFEHAPGHARATLEGRTRCDTRHRASMNALYFPACLLDRPMPARTGTEWRDRLRDLEARAAGLARSAPISRRLRLEILLRLAGGAAQEGAVAAALGLSERSLRRRLAEEGQSYAALLASCRVETARQLLQVEGLRLPDIAERVGYSDVTAFERAFRRIEGRTPAQFRRGLYALL